MTGNAVTSAIHSTRQPKKGMAARAIVLLSRPVMFCRTKRCGCAGIEVSDADEIGCVDYFLE